MYLSLYAKQACKNLGWKLRMEVQSGDTVLQWYLNTVIKLKRGGCQQLTGDRKVDKENEQVCPNQNGKAKIHVIDVPGFAFLFFPLWFFLFPYPVSFVAVLSFLWGEKKTTHRLELTTLMMAASYSKSIIDSWLSMHQSPDSLCFIRVSPRWPPSHLLSHT